MLYSHRQRRARRVLSSLARLFLAFALALSTLALPGSFLPTALAGDADSPLQVRMMGTCEDDPGLGIVHVGLGLDGITGDTFDITGLLPGGATIVEAWLYWNGADEGNSPEDDPNAFNPAIHDGDPTVTLNGIQVDSPTRIGGPAFIDTSDFSYAYRADVSSIVEPSTLLYVMDDLDNLVFNNGAELVIVYQAPGRDPHVIGLAEGLDLAKGPNEPASGPGTKAVIFQFEPAQVSRTASLGVFLGGAGITGVTESNSFWWLTGDDTVLATLAPITDTQIITATGAIEITEPFTGLNNQNTAGFWDSYNTSVTIPAGATFVAVQVESKEYTGAGTRHEWVGATMEMQLACPEYELTKTRTSDDFVQPGEAVVFDIVIENLGNTDIVTATLTDEYDPTFLTYNPTGTSPLPDTVDTLNGLLTWDNVGPIAFGSSITVTVAFTAAASTQAEVGPPAGRTVNTAFTSNVQDENGEPGDEQEDDDDVSITDPAVSIIKTLITPADGSTTVGSPVQFQIVVSNDGDTELVTVPVTDTYDATFLTFVDSTPTPTTAVAGTLTWANVGPIAVGDSFTITVNFTAAASTQGQPNDQTINTAIVDGVVDENGDSPEGDDDEEPVEIGDPAVSITKTLITPASGFTTPGSPVQFEIVVSNDGDTILTTVPVTDTYDATYLTFNSSTPTPTTAVAGTLTWANVGPIAVGSSTTITVNFTAAASTQALLPDKETINTAIVDGVVDENGETPPGDQDDAAVNIGAPSVALTKTRTSPSPTLVGFEVVFDLVVTNTGDTVLATMTVTDTYDTTYLQFDSSTPTPDATSPGVLVWDIVTPLAPSNSITIEVRFTALASTQGLPDDQTINSAEVSNIEDEYGVVASGDDDEAPVEIFEPSSLGNFVWEDLDGDGVQDGGEPGIDGVTVNLYLASDLSTPISTTVTSGGGLYSFVNLFPGDYVVEFEPPTGYVFTVQNSGSATTATDSDANPTTGRTITITLPEGVDDPDWDAGLYQPITIGDFIFLDANGDGIQQGGETTGVPNVPITATNLTLGLTFNTTSDATGNYLFENLPPGVYTMDLPATLPLLLRTTLLPAPFLMQSGDVDLTKDFGYINPTSVELAQVYHSTGPQGVTLHWSTRYESGADTFLIYRALSADGSRKLITPAGIPSEGNPAGATYAYTDATVSPGVTYYYWIEIAPQGDVHGPVVVPYSFQDPGDGGARRVFIPLVLR